MNSTPGRLDVVGSNMANSLNRAVGYYQHMAKSTTAKDDPQTYLRNAITAAQISLEQHLRGYDSFDALAFTRLAAGP